MFGVVARYYVSLAGGYGVVRVDHSSVAAPPATTSKRSRTVIRAAQRVRVEARHATLGCSPPSTGRSPRSGRAPIAMDRASCKPTSGRRWSIM